MIVVLHPLHIGLHFIGFSNLWIGGESPFHFLKEPPLYSFPQLILLIEESLRLPTEIK
jgi:hypothetical protein